MKSPRIPSSQVTADLVSESKLYYYLTPKNLEIN